MTEKYFVFFPVFAIFGLLGWLIFFVSTLAAFQKMETRKRIMKGIEMATDVTLALFVILFLFFYFLAEGRLN